MSGAARQSLDAVATLTVADLIAILDASECWRAVPGWPYEVSSWGNVRRVGTGRILEPAATKHYLHVTLSDDNVQANARVHRLVIEAFWGPPPFPDAEAAHNDGNPHHNRASNLRWATKTENQADRVRHGTDLRGSKVYGAKLTEADIPVIRRRIASGERYQSIADDYGVDKSNIGCIAVGKTWRHVPNVPKARAAA